MLFLKMVPIYALNLRILSKSPNIW